MHTNYKQRFVATVLVSAMPLASRIAQEFTTKPLHLDRCRF